MPKTRKLESYKYRFLIAAQGIRPRPSAVGLSWRDFLDSLEFSYADGSVTISWESDQPGRASSSVDECVMYHRGDTARQAEEQQASGMLKGEDPVKLSNSEHFKEIVQEVANAAGFEASCRRTVDSFTAEREFHDEWADSTAVENIDVVKANEACTSPEMRYISERLGNLEGKKLLDVGCGLGEASVYFAIKGAEVTSSDLSPGMLDATCRLAQANGVSVTPHVSAAEDLKLPEGAQFDIIYAGNLLHHVDIEATLQRVKPHLKRGGQLVTWDPLAYNPAINIYRKRAMEVRTKDEHPLTTNDLRLFQKYFSPVETRFFWLTTLVVFVIMSVFQRRDPNKERYWKAVVEESETWAPIYKPLEFIDSILLKLLPPLRLLCWNVVIVARKD